MSGIIFDTTIYIKALRDKDLSIFSQKQASLENSNEQQPLWLSAVVLEELYVGAVDGKMRKFLEKFEKECEKVNRLLVPNQTDWTICGQVLCQVGQKHGFDEVKRARMTNDCLIAMTTLRKGLTVFTHNADDFRKIAEFRPFNWVEVQ